MWVSLNKKPVNFFKHADNDADGIIEFSPSGSVMFMLFSLLGLQAIGEQTNDVDDSLTTWIAVHEPNLLREDYLREDYLREDYRNRLAKSVPLDVLAHLRTIPKRDFLQAFFRAREQIGSVSVSGITLSAFTRR